MNTRVRVFGEAMGSGVTPAQMHTNIADSGQRIADSKKLNAERYTLNAIRYTLYAPR